MQRRLEYLVEVVEMELAGAVAGRLVVEGERLGSERKVCVFVPLLLSEIILVISAGAHTGRMLGFSVGTRSILVRRFGGWEFLRYATRVSFA